MANFESYLPLGSVVQMKAGEHPILVIGRGVQVKKDDNVYFFDYVGVPYPEGLTGVDVCYFNNDWIENIKFIGLNDEANREISAKIHRVVEQNPGLKRCPQPTSSPDGANE